MVRKFHLGDILSITTGKLLSLKGMDGVYDILNYMTGDNLFTHQLLRAQKVCASELFNQHPQLRDIDASKVNSQNWKSWLKKQTEKFGKVLPVLPLPLGSWEHKDPIQELLEMGVPREKIIIAHL